MMTVHLFWVPLICLIVFGILTEITWYKYQICFLFAILTNLFLVISVILYLITGINWIVHNINFTL